MIDAHRPKGRFFCWILGCVLLAGGMIQAHAATMTRVRDTVYRADGTPAKGTVVISWPAFTTSSGEAVAAGRMSVAIGESGLLDVLLVPNSGSQPASHYEVVIRNEDGTSDTEIWVVPAEMTATLAQVRAKQMPASLAVVTVSRDYVDSALAAKASQTEVVHATGDETVAGIKAFENSPVVPKPEMDMAAANKSYVDQAIAAAGGGSAEARTGIVSVRDFGAEGGGWRYQYVSMAAGSRTVTFPLTLSTFPQPPQIGQEFRVAGAGNSGSDLVTTITAIGPGNTVTTKDVAGSAVSNRGVIWGKKTDNTAAFQAAVNHCAAKNGCTLYVPEDFYGIAGTITMPTVNGLLNGRITIQCMGGRQSTWLGWIGANQVEMFKAPAGSVPFSLRGCGLTSVDMTRKAIGLAWSGGSEHEAYDNFFQDLYEGIRASSTWLNKIEFNRFYSVGANAAIHFGPAGNGPVNATWVQHNEFGAYGLYGLLNDSTGSGGSQQNHYEANSFEGTTATTKADVQLVDNESFFGRGYWETGGSTDPNYQRLVINGGGNVIEDGEAGCIVMNGSGNVYRVGRAVIRTCPAPNNSYAVLDNGTDNRYEGVDAGWCSGSGCQHALYIHGPSAQIQVRNNGGAEDVLAAYPVLYSGPNAWSHGRAVVATMNFGYSNSSGANPSSPTDFGTSAVIPMGSIIGNRSFYPGGVNGNAFWVCMSSPCSANPLRASDWLRLGESSSKVRQEGTAAPASGTWNVGDFFWNTNPSSNRILGWVCTAAGSPGTWTAVYAIQQVFNASGALQAAAHTVIGSATLSGGSATVALSGASSFTGAGSYKCSVTDESSASAVRVSYSSGTQFVISGSGADTVGYVCVGN